MHYSHAQTPLALTKWSRAMAKVLTKHYNKGSVIPVFVYTGLSGIATATALMMALSAQKDGIVFGMMYVRKDGEDSHGQKIEVNMSENTNLDIHDIKQYDKNHEFVFVDDFICKGETLVRCALAYQNYMNTALTFSHDSFLVMTGYRRDPVMKLTPMFAPGDTPSYDSSPEAMNEIMTADIARRAAERAARQALEIKNF